MTTKVCRKLLVTQKSTLQTRSSAWLPDLQKHISWRWKASSPAVLYDCLRAPRRARKLKAHVLLRQAATNDDIGLVSHRPGRIGYMHEYAPVTPLCDIHLAPL